MYQFVVIISELYQLLSKWMRDREIRPVIIFLSIFIILLIVTLSLPKLGDETRFIINSFLAIIGLPLLIIWYVSLIELKRVLRKWLGGGNG